MSEQHDTRYYLLKALHELSGAYWCENRQPIAKRISDVQEEIHSIIAAIDVLDPGQSNNQ